MNNVIEADDVSHSFNGQKVLESIDWSIDAGENWALLGPSGSGKTTLMKIMSGYKHPNDGGTVTIKGDTALNLARWRRSVGWLSTDLLDRVPSKQSVLDTVVAGKHSQTLKAERTDLRYSKSDEDDARNLLRTIGLEDRYRRAFGELSQGERQLVLVARSFMGDPELLVLDEPCAGLDPGSRERFLNQLETFLSERPSTVAVYVSHHVEEFTPAFQRVLALKAGRSLVRGNREDVLVPDVMEKIYGQRFDLEHRDGRYWPVGTR